MLTFKIITFIVVSVVLVWFSWRPLHDPRSHGYYRFFAFEAILTLLLFNLEYWFRAPFLITQIISWQLLAVSMYLAAHGFYSLRKFGEPVRKIENTTKLVTRGLYKYIRHPLYASLLALTWGAFLKNPGGLASLLAATATISVIATAKVEEDEMLRKFGAAYHKYRKATKMFIPYLF